MRCRHIRQSQLPSATDDLMAAGLGNSTRPTSSFMALWSAAMDTRMKAGDRCSPAAAQNGAAIGSLAAKVLSGDTARGSQ